MSPEPDTAGCRERLRWHFFTGKALEDAALAVLRRCRIAAVRAAAESILFLLHRRILAEIESLPSPSFAGSAAPGPTGLGLSIAATHIAASDPAWAGLFAEEAALIAEFLDDPGIEIHHVGSTAVPGLPAKPIIDLAVGLPAPGGDAQIGRAIAVLGKLGYRYLGDRRRRGGHFLEKLRHSRRTHAVQLHPRDGADLRELLRFRDWLRADPGGVRDYTRIKAALAAAIGDDRRIYLWYKWHWISARRLGSPDGRTWSAHLIDQDFPSLLRMYGWGRQLRSSAA